VKRVRVLHAVGDLELGGGQKLTALVAASLDRDRFDVAVLNFGPPGPHGTALRGRGIPVIDLGLVRPLPSNAVRTWWRALRLLLRTVLRGRWDVVHTHMFLSAVVVTPLARLAGARAFGTAHRVYYGRRQTLVERVLSVLQDRIVVDSYAVLEILRAQTRIASDKYTVIHNGINVSEFADAPSPSMARDVLGLPRDAVVIAEVAHLAPHKGQSQLIEAFGRLIPGRPGLRLLLVGDGPARRELEAQVERSGLGGLVEFTGALGDLPTVLAAIDVLALPSTFEGFGIVQAEAMLLQRPVVATSHGGSTEVVEDGRTGFLVPFGDVDALARRLATLVDNRDLRDEMGRAGRARVLDRFTSDVMAAKYADLYLGLHGDSHAS